MWTHGTWVIHILKECIRVTPEKNILGLVYSDLFSRDINPG
jgi:hypothetical protein